MDKCLVSVVVFLDLEKHSLLINKLQTLGVNGVNLDWFASYLDCRQQQVFYNGELSATQSITTGVPQGSALGPLLFLVYVNELPNHIGESSISMFADDIAIYYSGTNIKEIEKKLNAVLAEISIWIKRQMVYHLMLRKQNLGLLAHGKN